MLFDKQTLDGLVTGALTRTYRRWTVVRVKVGSAFTTRVGVVRVTAVEVVAEDEITEADAHAAGHASLVVLRTWQIWVTGG